MQIHLQHNNMDDTLDPANFYHSCVVKQGVKLCFKSVATSTAQWNRYRLAGTGWTHSIERNLCEREMHCRHGSQQWVVTSPR